MKFHNQSFENILKQCESGSMQFEEVLPALQELAGDKLVEYLNQYFAGQIKSNLTSLLTGEYRELSETWRVLERIQVVICKFLYKENLKLDSTLEDFAHDFDRIDDAQMQAYVFDRLKRHELSYA